MKIKDKVLVGFPVGGSCHPAFTKSLCNLQKYELLNPSDDYEILDIEYSASLYVQENRNILVELAQNAGANWLLQIDTDEEFEPIALRQLMKSANKEHYPIVSGLYSNIMKGNAEAEGYYYHMDMVYREIGTGEYTNLLIPSDSHPFEVDAVGSGFLLTHMSIYDRIEYPWFWVELIKPTGKARPQIMNEDIAFSRVVREAGYRILVDPRVEIVHYKSIGLSPSTFTHFINRAEQVEKEMRAL